MSFRDVASVTNIVFLAGGIYFAAVGATGEATIYSIVPAVLCFVAFGLSFRENLYFAGPWRVATAVSILVLLVGQEISSFSSTSAFDPYTIGTILLNGALFVLFFGVLLSSAREITKQERGEEEEMIEETEP
jgi:hypothetical protein